MEFEVTSFVKNNLEIVGLILTVVLAIIGYLVSHYYNVRRMRSEASLQHTKEQLQYLYGPLYSLVESNTAAWKAFRKSFRPSEPLFSKQNPMSTEELEVWKEWAESVFIPSNMRIQNLIESNAHLYLNGEMPETFRKALAHLESSKIVLPSLARGNVDILDNFDPWPKDLNAEVKAAFDSLIEEYISQLGRVHKR